MRFFKSLVTLVLALAIANSARATTQTYEYKDVGGNIFNVQLFQCVSGPIFCTAMVFENSSGQEIFTTANPAILDTGTSGNLINAVKALPVLTSGTPGVFDTNSSGNLINAVKAIGQTGTPSIVDTNSSGNLINAIKSPPGLGTSGGWTPLVKAGMTNTVIAVKTSGGQLGFVQCDNPNTGYSYIQIFNAATGSVTVGTTPPTQIIPIPGQLSSGFAMNLVGMQYSTAISVAATTLPLNATAPGTAVNCTFGYN